MDTSDDATLVARAQAGDRLALERLLERHYPRVHAVCRRITGSAADADDAAQEALIRAVRHLGDFAGQAGFGTWLYRIATNAALDELRRRGRRPVPGAVDAAPRADPMAEREVTAVVDRMVLDEALAGLTAEFRTPVVLRDVAGLDYSEIATVLDVPIGTVKSRIARGRRQLVDALGGGDARHSHPGNRGAPPERPNGEPPAPPAARPNRP